MLEKRRTYEMFYVRSRYGKWLSYGADGVDATLHPTAAAGDTWLQ